MQTTKTAAAQPALEGQYKRRWGDRRDGRLVRSLPAMNKLMPFIMIDRNDACNSFSDEFEVSEVERYVREKREQGLTGFTMMHVLIAAYVRTVSQRPGINRFVSGQRIYSRHCVEINLCVKKEMKMDSPDSVLSIKLSPDATALDVYNVLNAEIEKTKNEDTSFDATAAVLDRIPRPIKRFVVYLLRTLDYYGLLPKFLTDLSPFHGSFFITSMASLGLPPLYHHIYNFGNVPVFMAFGVTQRRMVPQRDSSHAEKHYMGYSVVMDERICDGYYFASAFRYLSGIMRNPRVLDEKPAAVQPDID